MMQKLVVLWQNFERWNQTLKPLQRLYLGCLLALGFGQGLISIVVLLLGPDKPVGSR